MKLTFGISIRFKKLLSIQFIANENDDPNDVWSYLIPPKVGESLLLSLFWLLTGS